LDKQLARGLINAGVHFGHAVSRWNPKMKPYIFARRGMIHIIDVKETLKGLLIAQRLLVDIVSGGKDVVFVGTKRQAQKTVQQVAEKCKMHYVSERWLGGTLTNFRTIRARLQRLEQLEAMDQAGTMATESKKRAASLRRELRKIKSNLDGIRRMSRLPGAVIVVDVAKEYLALREARKLGIATIGIIDTNSDPDTVDVAIPANDDSIKAIELILNELADAVALGKTTTPSAAAGAKPARGRSRRPTLARAEPPVRQPAAEPAEPQDMPQQEEQALQQEPSAVAEEPADAPATQTPAQTDTGE